MSELYIYHLGLKKCRKEPLKDDIERYIVETTSKFLGDRESVQIQEDPLQLQQFILTWLTDGKIKESQVEIFCNRIRDSLHTRSVESERSLIIYLRNLNGDSILYIIHTKEKMDVVSDDFQKKLKVGLSPEKIHRVLQFSKIEKDKIQVNYKEINKTQFLFSLFSIPSDRFDTVGEVCIKCNLDANMDITITMTPKNFLDYYSNGNIKFINDFKSIQVSENLVAKLREIRYKMDLITPNKKKIEHFVKRLQNSTDPHEEIIDKYRAEYKSKKQQLGLIRDDSLDAFLQDKGIVDLNTIEFIEYPEIVSIEQNIEPKGRIRKPVDEWGIFIVCDDLIKISKEFSKDITQEMWKGLPRNARFIEIDYQAKPLKIGRFSWWNNFRLSENVGNLLVILQTDYDITQDIQKRKLLLTSMLFILRHSSGSIILKEFCENIIENLLDAKEIEPTLSRNITENHYFEFKRGDVLDSNIPIKDRVQNIASALQPNLNMTGLCVLLIGYDEAKDEITPVSFTFYKSEIQKQIIASVKQELANPNLKLGFFNIGHEKEEGIILILAMNPDKVDIPDINGIFQ